MRNKSFILVAVFLLLLLGGAGAVYAYDSARQDLIAEGVVVADVDVGGMRADEARAVLRREIADPIERPVVVVYRGRKFKLSPKQARLRADIGGMVDEAVTESRQGNLLTRAARDLSGGEANESVLARVSYSEQAVQGLARRVARELHVPARDASVQFSSTGLGQVESRAGLAVKRDLLARRVSGELTNPASDRTVGTPVRVVKPKITTAELGQRYPAVVTVDRASFTLRLFTNLRLARSYQIAVGQVGFDTPAGLYHIQNKGINVAWQVPERAWAGALAGQTIPGGAPNNPLKARWLGIYDGAGIHGTDQTSSLGSAASHGCIRMAIPEVIDLYDRVAVGTPIYIA